MNSCLYFANLSIKILPDLSDDRIVTAKFRNEKVPKNILVRDYVEEKIASRKINLKHDLCYFRLWYNRDHHDRNAIPIDHNFTFGDLSNYILGEDIIFEYKDYFTLIDLIPNYYGEKECVVCFEINDQKNSGLCGHYCVCSKCWKNINNCPMCKQDLTFNAVGIQETSTQDRSFVTRAREFVSGFYFTGIPSVYGNNMPSIYNNKSRRNRLN